MFKNPLKKYQTGGSAPTQEQQNDMREFVGWLKSNVEGFKDKSENEIAQSILDMSKSDEGKKSVQDLYSKFKKSKNQPKSRFENGGKIQDFICKHAKGGTVAGCGCGGSVVKGQQGVPGGVPGGYTVLPRTWQNNSDGSTSSEQIAVDPIGQAIKRVIIDRSKMQDRGSLPIRDTLRLGGYYDPEGFVSDGDITFGREVDPIFDAQKKQEGGEIQYSEIQPNVALTRRQARLLSRQNKGYNRGQFQTAMANADIAGRNAGLRGKELRNWKRNLVSGISAQDRTLVSTPTVATLNSNEPTVLNTPTDLVGVPERVVVAKKVVSEPIATRKDYPLQVNIPTVSGSLPERVGRRSNNTQAQSDRDRNMGRVEQYMRITGADEAASEWNSDQLAKDYAAKHGITLNEVPINRESEAYQEGVNQANREAAIATGVGIVAAPTAAYLATTGIPAAFNYGKTALTRALSRNTSSIAHPLAEDVMRGLNFGRGPIVNGRSIYYVSGPGAFLKNGGKFKTILHK